MLHSVVRNFSAFSAAYVAAGVVTFLFLIYAARKLGPEFFGQYLLVGAYVAVFGVTFSAGVMVVAVREIVRQRDSPREVFEQVLSLRLVLGLLAYVTLMIIVGLVLPQSTFLGLTAIAGAGLVVNGFKDSFAAYHTAFERMSIPGAFQVADGILVAICGAVLLYLDFGIVALLAGTLLVNLLVTVAWHLVFYRQFQRYRLRFALRRWKGMLLKVAPIAPLQLAIQFNRLASVMMLSLVSGPVSPERAVGQFGSAHQLVSFPRGLLVGLRRAMVPPLAQLLQRGERIDEPFTVALNAALIFLCFPLVVATSLFPREILMLAFGPEYVESALTLQLLGVASALWIAATFPESFLVSYPEQKFTRFLVGAYVPLLVNVALCLALIPGYGPVGAALAILVARAVHLIFVLGYCYALLPVNRLRPARLFVPLAVLIVSYFGCLLAARWVDQAALRGTLAAVIAMSGMLVAGRAELGEMRKIVFRRG